MKADRVRGKKKQDPSKKKPATINPPARAEVGQ
jgi:hypothetical protein